MERKPLKSIPLDMRSAMNMGFTDEVAGDGKGGWTDQGPDNDMTSLPVGKLSFKGLEFDIVNPSKNNGKSCIAMKSKRMPFAPSSTVIEFPKRPEGKYLYLLHALSFPAKKGVEIGELSCLMDCGENVEKQTLVFPFASGVDVHDFWMPHALPNASVAWHSSNASAPVGLYVTRIELSGKSLLKLTISSRNNCNWLIVGATLSDTRIDPKVVEPVTIKADENWLPIKNPASIQPGSAIDFSGMLHKPAGKFGRVVCRGNHFELKDKPGAPFRFYGSNIVYWVHYLSHEAVDKMADNYAAIGYNIIRLHMFDIPQSVIFENGNVKTRPEFQDKLDYLVAAFKKRGIYITFDIFGTRHITKGELADFPDEEINHKDFKGLIFVSKSALENYKSYTSGLMNHVNPYTGFAWKDEPAIATLSLVNEGTIFNSATRSAFIQKQFQKKFDKYLKERNIKISKDNHGHHWRNFLSEIYARTYKELRRFMKEEIGTKIPITEQNYQTSIPLALMRDKYDFTDNHFYWAHPLFPNGKFNSLPYVVMNQSSIGCYAGGVSSMFISRILNKPFTITEWDYTNPNSYNVEGAFLTGAYASLQDWSGLCRFSYAQAPQQLQKSESALDWFFPSVNDPLRLLSERAGIAFFLRGDVEASKVVYPFLVSSDYIKNPENTDEFPPLPNRLGLIGRTGVLVADPEKPLVLPEGSRALMGNEKIWEKIKLQLPYISSKTPLEGLKLMQKDKLLPKGSYESNLDIFKSSTGQICLERKANSFLVSTPLSEGFVLKADRELKGEFASVANKLTFGAFLVASIDDQKTLAESGRILILHLTDTKNSNMRFSGPDMNTCENNGSLPLLVRRGKAEMALNRDFSGFNLYALNLDGSRFAKVPMKTVDGKTQFTLKTDLNGNAIAAYELVKE